MAKYKAGDEAYLLESNRFIRKVTVAHFSGGMYLIKFENGGGIQVKEHRLFDTEEDAKAAMPNKPEEKLKRSRTPYDYM